MALTVESGPFGERSKGTFNFVLQPHTLYFEDSPCRVRVMFGSETVADSRSVKLLHETDHLPIYFFPRMTCAWTFSRPRTTRRTALSRATPRTDRVGDRVAENAVWSYPEPIESCPPIGGYLAFYWNTMDASFLSC